MGFEPTTPTLARAFPRRHLFDFTINTSVGAGVLATYVPLSLPAVCADEHEGTTL